MTSICDMVCQYIQKKEEEKRIAEDQAAKYRYWKIPICYDDDEDYTIAITPILSTEEPVDSLIMEDDRLDAIPATESDEVIKSTFKEHYEIVVDFSDDSTSSDDDSPYGEDINYVDASPPDAEIVSSEVINALKYNPTPSSDFVSSLPPHLLTFSWRRLTPLIILYPKLKPFCFNLEEISSGSPTSYSDLSLPDYEAFYFDDDHIKEKSSGNTTTHADFSQYDPFIFDLSIDSFPLTDRSDFYHEEFADELAHIISPPEYDCFYIKSEPDPGELTSIVDFGIRENVLPTTNVNLPFEDAQSPLWAYVVWIFLSFLTYPVTRGNEDTIFDPDISVYDSFMLGISHRSGTFMKFNVYLNYLNENPMEILSSTCSTMDQ
ncbi:hypothetical protein Tco_0457974 [Tanacetum coccineum]